MNNQWVDLGKFDTNILAPQFQSAKPYNHIYIDDFFNQQKLEVVLDELNNENFETWDKRDHKDVQIKWRSNWQRDEDVPPTTYNLVQFLNSGNFLRWLTALTGIQGIIPDPYLTGGGFNQINSGGVLGVHADGNWHDLMGVHRRLNVVLYLNKDWREEWGGHLELWSKNADGRPGSCVQKIAPHFNRMCIFRTDDWSFHGHPAPLTCPENRSRQSLILYYYTSTRPEGEVAVDGSKHRALFYGTK